ncbi:MAG: rod shape-determining protein [Paludibacter sp.]|nr:rod shape-determining protein [Paludibacter sp.]
MSDKNQIIAADLGSSHIALMAAEVVNGAVRVVSGTVQVGDDTVKDFDSAVRVLAVEENYRNGYVSNGVVLQTSGVAFQIGELAKRLNNFLHLKKGKEISSIYVSVNAKSMRCVKHTVSHKFERVTEINAEHLSEMENKCCEALTQGDLAVYEIFPIDYIIDNKHSDKPPYKQKGNIMQVEYTVVVGDKIIEEKIKGVFDRFDKNATKITPKKFKPLSVESLAKAVLSPYDCKEGTALLNLGATTTTLALYINGQLDTLIVVPLGSHNITKDIQAEGISEFHAENLKCLRGVAMESMVVRREKFILPSAKPDIANVQITTIHLAEIIQARLDEIFVPIFQELKKNKNKIGGGIVITGGGSNLNGIAEYIQKNTNMYVRFGKHDDKLTENTDKKFADPVYAQLIGMCLLIDSYRKKNPEADADEPTAWKKIKDRIERGLSIIFIDEEPVY